MEEKFKIGDIVQLKSGGPEMTIEEAIIDPDFGKGEFKGKYKCTYYRDQECIVNRHHQDTLDKVENSGPVY